MGCISYLSHCCGEHLQKQRKEQGSISLTFPGETVTGMVWEQEQEESGHIASTVKKQEEVNVGFHLLLSFIVSLRAQSVECYLQQLG